MLDSTPSSSTEKKSLLIVEETPKVPHLSLKDAIMSSGSDDDLEKTFTEKVILLALNI